MTAFANGHVKAGGRKKGARNKRTLAAAARPDPLAHLEATMTSKDGTVTPDLKLRAAIALAAYRCSKPIPLRSIEPIPYTAPRTVEEARAAILELGERLASGEIPIELHDSLVAGIRVFLGDKAAEQERMLDELRDALQNGEAHELRQ